MATQLDYKRLRDDVGASIKALDNDEAEAIFVEASETYTGAATLKAATRVIAINRLLAPSANETDYSQDTTTEKASQKFDHLYKLLALWEGRLGTAIADEKTAARSSSARFGGLRRKPARVQEWPNA